MKLISINSVPYGSTAKIMYGISSIAKFKGLDNTVAMGYSGHPLKETPKNAIKIGSIFNKAFHIILSKITGKHGFFSIPTTKRLVKIISKEKFDLIHLHNLHGWYINIPILFSYINQNNISVVWTLHDCWAFTGQCPHFTMAKCDKWKIGCHHCPQYREYPGAYVDRTKKMYRLKKEWFTGVSNLTIVTPSEWLAGLVKQSFLKDYPVRVIHNGIDLSIFRPTESDFSKKHDIGDKFIVLGVAFGWGVRKGLDIMIELSKRLDDEFQLVLVGTDNKIDKQLPENIISIHRTQNQQELAEIYTAADVFINPTREDNYPTVNMEAIACGTPVITFRTGGSPEMLDNTCGVVVDCDDIEAMEREIIRVCRDKPFGVEDCLKKAQTFDMNDKFMEYIKLYEEMDGDKRI